jgi:hypothetical protein
MLQSSHFLKKFSTATTNQQRSDWRPMAATLVDVWCKRYDQAITIWHGTTTYQDHKALAFRGIFFLVLRSCIFLHLKKMHLPTTTQQHRYVEQPVKL